MSNETKYDVFKDVVETLNVMDGAPIADYCKDMIDRYDAALPDNLPVIPEAVSEWLTWCKRKHHLLKDALDGETRVSEDVFARAWVLGVWRVEETGEIVKLEVK